MSIIKYALAGLIYLSASLTATAIPVTFSDGTFNNADWTGSITNQAGPAVSFSAQQVSAGGNPGKYRSLQQTYGGPGSIITGHVRAGDIYNPGTQGAVSSVSFSYDLKGFNLGNSGAVGYGGLISQNGSFYSSAFSRNATGSILVQTTRWESHSLANLIASDFGLLSGSGPGNPDFSASGTQLQFGYFGSNGTGNNFQTSTVSGIDNWSVSIQSVSTSVPEPGVLGLFGLGLLGLGLVRRRRA